MPVRAVGGDTADDGRGASAGTRPGALGEVLEAGKGGVLEGSHYLPQLQASCTATTEGGLQPPRSA